jgi:hypothetical protein
VHATDECYPHPLPRVPRVVRVDWHLAVATGSPQCMNGSTRICIMHTHDGSMSWQLERVHSRVQRVIGFLRCKLKGGPTGLCPRPQCVRMGDKRSRQCAPFTLALSFRVSGLHARRVRAAQPGFGICDAFCQLGFFDHEAIVVPPLCFPRSAV